MAAVVAVIDDLFFVSKLEETAKQVGAELHVMRAADFRAESLRDAQPALAVFDLNAASANPVELIRQLKADAELKGIPVVAFLSHVQVDLQRAAQQAGADQVLPRSKFTAQLADIFRRAAASDPRPATSDR
jgi:CheY-like chemotaxis protein